MTDPNSLAPPSNLYDLSGRQAPILGDMGFDGDRGIELFHVLVQAAIHRPNLM
ncbi:hypothetical protein ACSBOX_18780 [Arthrobacter sp. KN11-1C]|uniref:hypothetical protein n=1 Tax=Arthrobacter sp. KN11-1C TaxID=3445774 RepID=UPI003F9F4B21